MKRFVILLIFVFLTVSVKAQTSALILDNGIKPHSGVDEIYRQFSIGYKTLNVDLVANLYDEKANYLASGSSILDGRAQIRQSFAKFFDSIRKDGQTLEISFRIMQREVDKNLGYDVGIYTLKSFKDGKQVMNGRGKFVVITKNAGKSWVFRYDSYSNLPTEKKE